MSDDPILFGFQDSFRSSVRSVSDAALELIGTEARLEHVLIAATPSEGAGKSYIVPASAPATSVDLNEVSAEADERREQHPEANVIDSHHYAREARQNRIRLECVAKVIEDRVNAAGAFSGKPVATTVVRPDYDLTLCLVIPEWAFEGVPTLPPHTWGTLRCSTSVLDAVLQQLLGRISYDLRLPEPGPQSPSLSAREIVDRGASQFFREALYRAGTHDLLTRSVLDRLASATYEQSAAAGHLLVAREDHTAITADTRFTQSVPTTDARQLRKLLETSSPAQALLVADGRVYGLGHHNSELANDPDNDVLEIAVTGHGRWELRHHDARLMVSHRGAARVPRPSFDVSRLRDHAPRRLGDAADVDVLVQLVAAASGLGHGSTLVVATDAAAEAERLGGQAVRTTPQLLTPERLADLGNIDGAFVLDPMGTMHAFGVILDGIADGAPGDPARGSRYNSAVRYVHSREHDGALAIVTSDDGGVDIIPEIPLRVPRSLPEDTLLVVEATAANPSRRWEFADAVDRLRALEDYLSKKQAERANEAIANDNEARRNEGTFVITRRRFEGLDAPPDDYFM